MRSLVVESGGLIARPDYHEKLGAVMKIVEAAVPPNSC